MAAPLYSVVMPAFNAEATIESSIRSVLAQDYTSWELMVTDDGSTDDTRAICDRVAAQDSRIRVASQKNAGAGAAVNASIMRSSGKFIVRLDADDELLPDYFSKMNAFIEAHPDYDIYSSNLYRLLPDGTRELYHQAPRFEHEFSLTVDDMLDECQIHVNAVFRREVFDRVGGFRTEFYNEDYDFWLRAMMAGAKHIYNPVPLALYRVVPGQKTENAIRMRSEDIRILRDAIDSGKLTPEQVEHAKRTIGLLESNVAFRKRVASLVGPRLADPIFKLAHKAAWIIRPYRKRV